MANKWTFTTNDVDEAKRMTRSDDAYHTLWEISQKLRSHYKYGAKAEDVLSQINDEICDSKLMELWR